MSPRLPRRGAGRAGLVLRGPAAVCSAQLSTADNIVDPPTPFPEYAAELVGRTEWRFWWT
ncbi:hypothetical protein ACIBW9_01460 [Streptomyces sp. NPDC049541]|uniref:hypothetical protein n=1 Tax=Streptomyces sp. NPDC049541 TaxID=3365594 RepID=UPI0037AAB6F3